MRKLGFVCLLAGLLLIAGSVWLQLQRSAAGTPPDAVLALERSLARPGLLALATLDVGALRRLGVGAGGDGEPPWSADLSRAGIEPGDLTHATFALTTGADGEAEAAFAVFGRFDPAAVEQALRAREDVEVERAELAGRPVLRLSRIDRESCEESGPWALHAEDERLLLADPDALAAILDGAAASDGALRDLGRFQRFRAGQLVSAALFVPDELPGTSSPLVGMAALGAKQQVEDFRAVYAGAEPRWLPAGLGVEALLEGTRPGVAAEKAAAWQAWLDRTLADLGARAPTLATLHEALELRAEGDDLRARFHLSRADVEQLRRLPGELGSLLFGGMRLEISGGSAPGEERLARNPRSFLAQVSREDLATYDPEVTLAEPVDRITGPFGLRLSAVRLAPAREGDGSVAELEIDGFATRLPNLGDDGERVSFAIESIEGQGGEELLAWERCGPDRNDRPAGFDDHFGGEILRATKTVRLRPGARPDDVARIVGAATLRLPTRTETLSLPAEPGAVERGGARLEITRVEGGSVAYAVSGETASLLHLRALNAEGRPLADESTSSMSAFGGGRSATRSFAGAVHAIEAVFALEQQELRYPFELVETRPASAGELLADAAADPPVEALRIRGALEDWLSRAAARVEAAVAGSDASPGPVTRAGPFALRLEAIWPFGGLMPRIDVRAPRIPGLEDRPGAVELRLDELHMLDGTVHRGAWGESLLLQQEFGGEALVATSQLETGVSAPADQVARVRGRVAVRLPARVGVLSLERVELGAALDTAVLALSLVELGRDRFVLRAARGGERVIGARALNGSGQALFTRFEGVEAGPDGALDLEFQARGRPQRIELRIAEELSRAEYPFELDRRDLELAGVR